jgi:hypothetical protein
MDTYEYPLGMQFKASTPEHAAARVFGGKPADYLATVRNWSYQRVNGKDVPYYYVEVSSADGTDWIGDIPIVSETS